MLHPAKYANISTTELIKNIEEFRIADNTILGASILNYCIPQ